MPVQPVTGPAAWGSLPFEEAIAFFMKKLSFPAKHWDEVWQAAHSQAFTVAGAMEEALLGELRAAVQKGLTDGTTLETFRQDFSRIVDQYDWNYNGGFGWRSEVIFNTNMSTAYSAGRYQQQMDPDALKERPYLRYVASSSADPRPEHMAWYNLILPADDPFWATHYPPNGWGCKCGVVSASAADVERLTAKFKDTPNPVRRQAPRIETYEWLNPRTGETMSVPFGIDPGWAYNPGQRAAGPIGSGQ